MSADGAGPAPSGARAKPRDLVGALSRGLEVLHHCALAPDGVTLAEVARAVGQSPATVRRSLLTLVDAGYLVEQERRFLPAPRILSLAGGLLGAGPARVARPILEALSRTLGESVSVASLDGTDIVYVARAEARRIVALDLAVGARLPAACTSMGRVLLAYLAPAARQRHLPATLVARTDRTVTEPAQLARVLEQVRADAFCIVDGELEPGLRSLAVPVAGADGAVAYALNVSTQSARIPARELRRAMLPALRRAAADLAPAFVSPAAVERRA